MKKIIIALILFFTVCIGATSCAPKSELLSYRSAPYSLNALLELKATGETFRITVSSDPESQSTTLVFEDSEPLSGVVFTMCQEEMLVRHADKEYPAEDFIYIKEVFGLLNADENDFVSAESSKAGQIHVNVLKFKGERILILESKSKMPLSFEGPHIKISVTR